jgi:drug/metabolite transporter (DMT)-like permease
VTGDPRLVRALLGCYPAGWRRRYGDEYAQLLLDLRVHRRPTLIVDSLRGALRAQLSQGGPLMPTRSPMTTAVWAAGLFTVAGIGFQKLAEGVTSTGYPLLVGAAAVALLALVAAAAPTALALLRGRDTAAWKYLAVPVVGAAAWYGVLRLALAISHGHTAHSAATITGFALIAGAGIAVVAATAWAASTVLRRVPATQPARLRPVALLVLAAGMAVTTVVALIWGLRVPTEFHGAEGILATPFAPSWIGVVALMAAATVLATTAGRRQLAATR